MAQHIRRHPRRLPSLRRHGLSAFLLLAILAFSVVIWLNLSAKNKPVQQVNAEMALPKPLSLETNDTSPLPDLLAPDNIPLDVNPTAPIDLVGGPKIQSKPKTQILPGKNPIDGPFMIDGRVISNSQQTITKYTPLIRAPIDGMNQMTPYGLIPQPHKDGRIAVNAYAKPFIPTLKTKYISLVVGGLGLNPSVTRKAINNLPGAVTLSFAADAPGLQGWVNKARAHGHEVMIELPMQGNGPVDTRTLTIAGPETANTRNLEYLLSRVQGYFAVTNYDGSRLVNDEAALLPIIQTLKKIGVGFVYDGALDGARIVPLARREGLPVVSANAYLDEERQDSVYVRRNIKVLHENSYDNVPIGMGFAYAGTIDGIKIWLATKPKNVELAPVSYALKTR